jgi:hypothetical protein
LAEGTRKLPGTSSLIETSGAAPLLFAADRSDVPLMLRPDAPTIQAVTKLMLAAGLSLEGKRPELIDIYQAVPQPPQAAEPAK